MNLWTKLKLWWHRAIGGLVIPPEGEEKSIGELLKGYDDEEWEE